MKPALFVASLLALTACDAGSETRPDQIERQARTASEQPRATSLTPAGAPQTRPADEDAQLQWSASVVRVDDLRGQGDRTVKLFGSAGGDPAMNGLYTYITFFQGAADGWRSFQIGDVLDYRILGERPGRVDIEVSESVLNPATDEIGSRTRRLIVEWTPGEDGAAPEAVTVTEAR